MQHSFFGWSCVLKISYWRDRTLRPASSSVILPLLVLQALKTTNSACKSKSRISSASSLIMERVTLDERSLFL